MTATVAGIHLGIDTHANRPAANTVPDGSLYSCSTHNLVYKSNFAGNSWATWATLGASGGVATDPIWDAAGDLAVGSGADTAAKLTKGADSTVLTISPSTHVPVWSAPSSGLPVPWFIAPIWYGPHSAYGGSGSNNRAVYYLIDIPVACTITGLRVRIGTSSGNVCVGLYDASNNRLATSGSIASPGTGLRSLLFTSGAVISTAGRYKVGIAADNTSVTFSAGGTVTVPGNGAMQATAFPLPDPAVPGAGTETEGLALGGPNFILIVSGGWEP